MQNACLIWIKSSVTQCFKEQLEAEISVKRPCEKVMQDLRKHQSEDVFGRCLQRAYKNLIAF